MKNYSVHIIYGGIILLIICISFFAYIKQKAEHTALLQELTDTKAVLIANESAAEAISTTLEDLKQAYAISEERGTELLTELTSEKERNETFEKQIGKISGTVGKLDKLSKIDPELLMKYSKVYFLNEHYIPEKVEAIASEFSFKVAEQEFINAKVEPYLRELLEDAKADGINILVVSGYRSYNEQKGLKTAYTTQYGSGANTFSADQGYSEHQLGTTVDFTTTEVGGGLTGFEKSEAYTWLQENAYKYGFVLSYPKDNTYYVFEPWHWRFIGEDLADDLNDDGKFFYDLDQREIDKYLISLFD